MDFDKKEISTYLDGVPFSIGQKFCPPRTVALPDDAIRYEVPQELLSEEYEFTVESKFLADIEAKKEKADEEQKQKAAKVKEVEMQSSSVSNGATTGSQPVNAAIPLWSAVSILQPKSKSPSKNVSSVRSDSLKKINLSDFENDTSSPFDYVELQTINDMEELSTVFQGLCRKEPAPTNKMPVDENSSVPSSEGLGNVSKSISFPLPEVFDLSKSTASSQSEPDASVSSVSSVSKSFAKNSENYLSYSYPNMPGAFSGQSGESWPSERVKRNSFASDTIGPTHIALSQVPFMPSVVDQNRKLADSRTGNISDCPVIPLRSSKSIPDLTNLLPKEEAVPKIERSHTPPATRTRSLTSYYRDEQTYVKVPFNNSVKQNIWSSNGLLTNNTVQPDKVVTEQEDQNPALPDPYDELSNSERRIVDFVTDMGFHRGQVSRTVKHLGTDEKKVVEHLCQIQALEESGYDKLEAETALHLHDYNKKEAIRYLDLLNQFQDLGFEKDAIRKALVQNKNDRDKVIDALLS